MNNHEPGMTLVVKSVTRLTLGFILLYGIYLGLRGDSSCGGGFVGGIIIALSLVHVMLAFGKKAALRKIEYRRLRGIVSVAALLCLYMVLNRFELMIPIFEMIIVGLGLFAIFVALVFSARAKNVTTGRE